MSEEETKSSNFDRVPVYYAGISEAESLAVSLQARVDALEVTIRELVTERAVDHEKQKFIEDRFNRLDNRLVKIEGHVARLVWLIIATILGALMSFLMRGAMITA